MGERGPGPGVPDGTAEGHGGGGRTSICSYPLLALRPQEAQHLARDPGGVRTWPCSLGLTFGGLRMQREMPSAKGSLPPPLVAQLWVPPTKGEIQQGKERHGGFPPRNEPQPNSPRENHLCPGLL